MVERRDLFLRIAMVSFSQVKTSFQAKKIGVILHASFMTATSLPITQ